MSCIDDNNIVWCIMKNKRRCSYEINACIRRFWRIVLSRQSDASNIALISYKTHESFFKFCMLHIYEYFVFTVELYRYLLMVSAHNIYQHLYLYYIHYFILPYVCSWRKMWIYDKWTIFGCAFTWIACFDDCEKRESASIKIKTHFLRLNDFPLSFLSPKLELFV